MREAIAEQEVIFEHRNGMRTAGVIRIEKPYVVDESECRCRVVIEGLHDHMPDISGSTTLQALLLAVCFCGSLLKDFVESGGRILLPREDEADEGEKDEVFDLDACFGVIVSAAAPISRRVHPMRKQA